MSDDNSSRKKWTIGIAIFCAVVLLVLGGLAAGGVFNSSSSDSGSGGSDVGVRGGSDVGVRVGSSLIDSGSSSSDSSGSGSSSSSSSDSSGSGSSSSSNTTPEKSVYDDNSGSYYTGSPINPEVSALNIELSGDLNPKVLFNDIKVIPTGFHQIKSKMNGNYCLDINGASNSNDAKLIISDCHGGNNQLFNYEKNGQLRVKHSNKCLTAKIDPNKHYWYIRQDDCWNDAGPNAVRRDDQTWFYNRNDKTFNPIILNKYSTELDKPLCMDVYGLQAGPGGEGVVAHPCNGGNNQQWDFL